MDIEESKKIIKENLRFKPYEETNDVYIPYNHAVETLLTAYEELEKTFEYKEEDGVIALKFVTLEMHIKNLQAEKEEFIKKYAIKCDEVEVLERKEELFLDKLNKDIETSDNELKKKILSDYGKEFYSVKKKYAQEIKSFKEKGEENG